MTPSIVRRTIRLLWSILKVQTFDDNTGLQILKLSVTRSAIDTDIPRPCKAHTLTFRSTETYLACRRRTRLLCHQQRHTVLIEGVDFVRPFPAAILRLVARATSITAATQRSKRRTYESLGRPTHSGRRRSHREPTDGLYNEPNNGQLTDQNYDWLPRKEEI